MTEGTLWALDTGRPGEYLQVETLGRALGLGYERIRLSPENEVLTDLPAVPPRLVLSFGRAAKVALRLARKITPRPLLVHLGTPGQTPITAFDLIIPMPQDDYPAAPNVQFLRLPLNGAAADPSPRAGGKGRCTVIVGGPSRHFRLPRRAVRALTGFGMRLALANGEALVVVTSPRTPEAVLAELRELRSTQGFEVAGYGELPFADILHRASRFVVTSDSASMLGEACRTGAPVWLFALPRRGNLSDLLQQAVDRFPGRRFRHCLVRLGWVGGGTDFRRWHGRLEADGSISMATNDVPDTALRWAPAGAREDSDLRDCRARILGLLARAAESRA